ncbi:telomerase Cajal body protein 1-like [Macrosteles quadrilineatus]|uniref:telomerase Cajal body protein 1-like n=1 Tax=Macrosteles quadrilineatus TaxID=74068 RepID=UPI0023E118BE|nr:telomerase Cajal body protein 1-like [Macrosteles quadrilineatus]
MDQENKIEECPNSNTCGMLPDIEIQKKPEGSEKEIDEQNENVKDKEENADVTTGISFPTLSFNQPKLITGSWDEFRPKNNHKEIFLKGCKWSPDGTCLLTNSGDATMRLFDLPLDLYNCQCLHKTDFPELQSAVV